MNDIFNPDYTLLLTPGRATDIALGMGFDMSDSLFPVQRQLAFPAPPPDLDIPVPDDLLASECTFTEISDYRREAEKISASFKVSFGIGSARAAYSRAREEINTKKIMYAEYGVRGAGASMPGNAIVWSNPPVAERIPDREQRARHFLRTYGSHYLSSVVYGSSIVIRGSFESQSESERMDFSASFKAGFGGWGGRAGLSVEQERVLKSQQTTILCQVVCGRVTPPAALYCTGYEDALSLLTKVKAGEIKIEPGPIECSLSQFWQTLYPEFPLTAGIFDQPTPVALECPYGVPKGTVLAWWPPPESQQRVWVEELNQFHVTVAPPQGWLLCNGLSGTPDLRGRFVRAIGTYEDIGETGGSEKHAHQIKGKTGYDSDGFAGGVESSDNFRGTNWNHRHFLDLPSELSDGLPPYATLVYVMKA